MKTFDYLIVLVSIVIGLAMTNVLTRLALAMQARERVNFYWPPVAWSLWIFFICVQHWWAQWTWQFAGAPTFGLFCLQLTTPVLLFLLSALALPDREEDGFLNLENWYFRNRKWFFGLLFFVPLVSILEEIVRTGAMASVVNLLFLLAFSVIAAISYFITSRRAGEWVTAQVMVMTLAYVALLYSDINLRQH
ncbi:MAG TPA: hypothetical protein VK760_10880 [Candidatus Acidoferrales bacterium]|jgi:hypothetical protein|nr:hypothetical protein [Candidatus Acidoferrales bacterium]